MIEKTIRKSLKINKNMQSPPEDVDLESGAATQVRSWPTNPFENSPYTDNAQHHEAGDSNYSSRNQRDEQDTTRISFWVFNKHRQKRILTLLIIGLGAVASAAFLHVGITGEVDEAQKDFERHASDLIQVIRGAWDEFEKSTLWIQESCHSVRSSPSISPADDIASHVGFCSREKFEHLYEYINSMGLEFVAMQYIPNITNSERKYLEDEARQYYTQRDPAMEYEGIKSLELSDSGSVISLEPSQEKPWYLPMHYILPIEGNEHAIDIDLFSFRQKAVEKAFATQKPVMGSRMHLFRDTNPNLYGIEFIHPGIMTTLDKALHRRKGLSKMVIRVPTLIVRASHEFQGDGRVYLFDESNVQEEPVFLAGADLDRGNVTLKEETSYEAVLSSSYKSFTDTIHIMDKKWKIVVQPLHGMHHEKLQNVIVEGAVIFIAGIFVAYWFHSHLSRLDKEEHIRSQAEAERAQLAMNQVKRERHLNDFIAHEVRNPLSSAIAALNFASSTTKEHVSDNWTRQALLDDIEIVGSSLEYINDFLKNMLDMNKTACNEMKLNISATNILKELFEPVTEILVPRRGTVQTVIECPSNLLADVDRLRMKQVILNLAINAVKFVDRGFIRLRADVVDENVHLIVEDSGPGIPTQKRDRLFEKFQESLDLCNEGTGIGLSVCKDLTQLMGGLIYLDEEYQSGISGCPGTRFVVNLQQKAQYEGTSTSTFLTVDESKSDICSSTQTDDEACHSDADISPCLLPSDLSVLLVDDDTVLRKLFVRSVKKVKPDWNVYQAATGEEALTLVEERAYDVIFMDQYMAGEGKMLLGTETVGKLRREKHVTSIICGLSANDLRQEFVEAGADTFILKPFPCEKSELQRKLIDVWSHRSTN